MKEGSLDERMARFKETIQSFQGKIKALPRAPVIFSKSRTHCDKALEKANYASENIKGMDIECIELHEESIQLWTTLIENE